MISREKYIESVENLIEKLNSIEEPKLKKFIEQVNKIYLDFNKSSFKNYERVTFLIGKEAANIRKSLEVFSRELVKIYEENKLMIDSFENFFRIKEKLNEINLIDKSLEDIKKSSLDKKIKENEEENKNLKQSLEEIKKSPAYLDNLSKEKEIESLREEIKKNIMELKKLIDFKALANIFHISEQMKTVKNFKGDFQTNFKKDKGETIINLLDEANLNNDAIKEKINLIRTKIEKVENYEPEDLTQEVSLKIKKIDSEIDDLKKEKEKEEKIEDKFKTNKKELISVLKEELNKINVEVIL